MSYVNNAYEVIMTPVLVSGALATTEGRDAGLVQATTVPVAAWAPGMFPHIVRGASVVLTAGAALASAYQLAFQHEKPARTADTATAIFTITVPTTALATGNNVVYKFATADVKIKPGEGVRAINVAAATAGLRGTVVLHVEPSWEQQANVTSMIQST